MRLIFFGTSEFALPSLKALIDSHHKIEMVITQPDRPKGRGLKVEPPAIKSLAQESDLRIEQPQRAGSRETRELIEHVTPDLMIVVAYGQILSKTLLSIPLYGGVNVHGSLLPEYRGASPISWAIIEGETKTGITTIQMDEGMDTGDIILQREMDILDDDTAGSLSLRLAQSGANVLMETLSLFEEGKVVRFKQNKELASYTRLLKKEDGLIDWKLTADRIVRLVRGLDPWPGAYSYLNGRRIRLWRAHSITLPASGEPGQVMGISQKDGLMVMAGEGSSIGITLIQPESKPKMSTREYICGLHGEKLEGKLFKVSNSGVNLG